MDLVTIVIARESTSEVSVIFSEDAIAAGPVPRKVKKYGRILASTYLGTFRASTKSNSSLTRLW